MNLEFGLIRVTGRMNFQEDDGDRGEISLWLASTNPGKLREFDAAAGTRGARVNALPGIEQLPPCVEDGVTFEENARKKAVWYSRQFEGLVFADDSGLCVDALGGEPGVFSARYAGGGAAGSAATDAANNAKLIETLRRVFASSGRPAGWELGEARAEAKAHYACVIALARRGCVLAITTGRADGVIISQARGSGGFGYDPYFFYPPLGRTFAELGPEEKFAVSHRGEAFRKLLCTLDARHAPPPAATDALASVVSARRVRRSPTGEAGR